MIRRKKAGLILILVGILLLMVPAGQRLYGEKKMQDLLEVFQKQMDSGDSESIQRLDIMENSNSFQRVDGKIEIESIRINCPVLEGTEQEVLRFAIGHMKDTAVMGQKGNCVLAGHNGSRYGTFFQKLKQVETGDIVKATDSFGTEYQYEVQDKQIVPPTQTSVLEQGEEEILTLLTCEQNGTMRLAVRCKLV